MHAQMLSIDATLRRILEIMETNVKPKREPRTVKLTDREWLSMLVDMYPNFDVPQCLRDCEAHYISKGQVMTRAKGAAWLKRQVEWNQPVSAPAKKRGLVL